MIAYNAQWSRDSFSIMNGQKGFFCRGVPRTMRLGEFVRISTDRISASPSKTNGDALANVPVRKSIARALLGTHTVGAENFKVTRSERNAVPYTEITQELAVQRTYFFQYRVFYHLLPRINMIISHAEAA